MLGVYFLGTPHFTLSGFILTDHLISLGVWQNKNTIPMTENQNPNNSDLHIPYGTVENHIQCAICLSAIRGAVLTPCGHRYCSRCITEWVMRDHRCPCCNSALRADQFYYDVQFDGLVAEVLLERDKAEQTFFDKMFIQDPDSSGLERTTIKSSFEEILKKHMKSSLLSHKQYFDRLRDEYTRKVNSLDKGLHAMTLTDGQDVTGNNVESLKETLQKNLEESERLAAEAFDRYLTEKVPSIDVLPVTVSVYIPDKNIRLEDIIIKPSDSLAVLKPILEDAMLARCDQIVSWNDDGSIQLLFGPMSKSSTYNIAEIINNIQSLHDVHQLSWDSRPIFQCHMCPGSEIVFHNVFKAESDLPRRCFANTFGETGPQPVDYFLCHRCDIKWICKSCIQCCHTGHDIAPFALRHVPTWACCYCPKKKLCKIQNK